MENKIIFYSNETGNVNINVTYQNENFWLSQKDIATLFGVEVPAISKHLANIYETGELQKQATTSILETVQKEGARQVKRNIFEQCSADYNKNSHETKLFYKMVQNKLHFAITGKTDAELIYDRVDKSKDFMGLTSWKNSPEGKILKSDVSIAKNYLAENEIGDLNLLVSAFLDLAEFSARRNQVMNMKDWLERTNKFLDSNSLDILPNAGNITHEQAVEKAYLEYEQFRIIQDKKYVSDLDKEIKKLSR